MAAGISARLTPADGRRFGCTVGTAFLLVAGIAWWRAHPTSTAVLGTLGAALILGGLAIPARLGPIERAWMALAHAISRVTTPVAMGGIFFLVLTPVGLLRRKLGRNPLVHRGNAGFWKHRGADARRSASMERQF